MEGIDDAERLATLRQHHTEATASTEKLREENRLLRRELRRAQTTATIAERLHHGRVVSPPRAAAPTEGASDADSVSAAQADGSQESTALRSRLLSKDELEELKAEVRLMQELMDRLATSAEVELADDKKVPETLLSENSFEMLATTAEVELADDHKAWQRKVRKLESKLAKAKIVGAGEQKVAVDGSGDAQGSTPSSEPSVKCLHPSSPSSATGGNSTESVGQRRESRRLMQSFQITARLHEELQRTGSETPTSPGSLASLQVRQTGSPESKLSDVTQVSPARTTMSDPRGQQLRVDIKKLQRRFLVRRDLNVGRTQPES